MLWWMHLLLDRRRKQHYLEYTDPYWRHNAAKVGPYYIKELDIGQRRSSGPAQQSETSLSLLKALPTTCLYSCCESH